MVNEAKISKLADQVKQSMRTYEKGKRVQAVRMIGKVASQIGTKEERKALNKAVERDIAQSQVYYHYRSIIC